EIAAAELAVDCQIAHARSRVALLKLQISHLSPKRGWPQMAGSGRASYSCSRPADATSRLMVDWGHFPSVSGRVIRWSIVALEPNLSSVTRHYAPRQSVRPIPDELAL